MDKKSKSKKHEEFIRKTSNLRRRKLIKTSKINESALISTNNQITQCVFLGALCLKPVPDIFQVTLQPHTIRIQKQSVSNNNYIDSKQALRNVNKRDKSKNRNTADISTEVNKQNIRKRKFTSPVDKLLNTQHKNLNNKNRLLEIFNTNCVKQINPQTTVQVVNSNNHKQILKPVAPKIDFDNTNFKTFSKGKLSETNNIEKVILKTNFKEIKSLNKRSTESVDKITNMASRDKQKNRSPSAMVTRSIIEQERNKHLKVQASDKLLNNEGLPDADFMEIETANNTNEVKTGNENVGLFHQTQYYDGIDEYLMDIDDEIEGYLEIDGNIVESLEALTRNEGTDFLEHELALITGEIPSTSGYVTNNDFFKSDTQLDIYKFEENLDISESMSIVSETSDKKILRGGSKIEKTSNHSELLKKSLTEKINKAEISSKSTKKDSDHLEIIAVEAPMPDRHTKPRKSKVNLKNKDVTDKLNKSLSKSFETVSGNAPLKIKIMKISESPEKPGILTVIAEGDQKTKTSKMSEEQTKTNLISKITQDSAKNQTNNDDAFDKIKALIVESNNNNLDIKKVSKTVEKDLKNLKKSRKFMKQNENDNNITSEITVTEKTATLDKKDSSKFNEKSKTTNLEERKLSKTIDSYFIATTSSSNKSNISNTETSIGNKKTIEKPSEKPLQKTPQMANTKDTLMKKKTQKAIWSNKNEKNRWSKTIDSYFKTISETETSVDLGTEINEANDLTKIESISELKSSKELGRSQSIYEAGVYEIKKTTKDGIRLGQSRASKKDNSNLEISSEKGGKQKSGVKTGIQILLRSAKSQVVTGAEEQKLVEKGKSFSENDITQIQSKSSDRVLRSPKSHNVTIHKVPQIINKPEDIIKIEDDSNFGTEVSKQNVNNSSETNDLTKMEGKSELKSLKSTFLVSNEPDIIEKEVKHQKKSLKMTGDVTTSLETKELDRSQFISEAYVHEIKKTTKDEVLRQSRTSIKRKSSLEISSEKNGKQNSGVKSDVQILLRSANLQVETKAEELKLIEKGKSFSENDDFQIQSKLSDRILRSPKSHTVTVHEVPQIINKAEVISEEVVQTPALCLTESQNIESEELELVEKIGGISEEKVIKSPKSVKNLRSAKSQKATEFEELETTSQSPTNTLRLDKLQKVTKTDESEITKGVQDLSEKKSPKCFKNLRIKSQKTTESKETEIIQTDKNDSFKSSTKTLLLPISQKETELKEPQIPEKDVSEKVVIKSQKGVKSLHVIESHKTNEDDESKIIKENKIVVREEVDKSPKNKNLRSTKSQKLKEADSFIIKIEDDSDSETGVAKLQSSDKSVPTKSRKVIESEQPKIIEKVENISEIVVDKPPKAIKNLRSQKIIIEFEKPKMIEEVISISKKEVAKSLGKKITEAEEHNLIKIEDGSFSETEVAKLQSSEKGFFLTKSQKLTETEELKIIESVISEKVLTKSNKVVKNLRSRKTTDTEDVSLSRNKNLLTSKSQKVTEADPNITKIEYDSVSEAEVAKLQSKNKDALLTRCHKVTETEEPKIIKKDEDNLAKVVVKSQKAVKNSRLTKSQKKSETGEPTIIEEGNSVSKNEIAKSPLGNKVLRSTILHKKESEEADIIKLEDNSNPEKEVDTLQSNKVNKTEVPKIIENVEDIPEKLVLKTQKYVRNLRSAKSQKTTDIVEPEIVETDKRISGEGMSKPQSNDTNVPSNAGPKIIEKHEDICEKLLDKSPRGVRNLRQTKSQKASEIKDQEIIRNDKSVFEKMIAEAPSPFAKSVKGTDCQELKLIAKDISEKTVDKSPKSVRNLRLTKSQKATEIEESEIIDKDKIINKDQRPKTKSSTKNWSLTKSQKITENLSLLSMLTEKVEDMSKKEVVKSPKSFKNLRSVKSQKSMETEEVVIIETDKNISKNDMVKSQSQNVTEAEEPTVVKVEDISEKVNVKPQKGVKNLRLTKLQDINLTREIKTIDKDETTEKEVAKLQPSSKILRLSKSPKTSEEKALLYESKPNEITKKRTHNQVIQSNKSPKLTKIDSNQKTIMVPNDQEDVLEKKVCSSTNDSYHQIDLTKLPDTKRNDESIKNETTEVDLLSVSSSSKTLETLQNRSENLKSEPKPVIMIIDNTIIKRQSAATTEDLIMSNIISKIPSGTVIFKETPRPGQIVGNNLSAKTIEGDKSLTTNTSNPFLIPSSVSMQKISDTIEYVITNIHLIPNYRRSTSLSVIDSNGKRKLSENIDQEMKKIKTDTVDVKPEGVEQKQVETNTPRRRNRRCKICLQVFDTYNKLKNHKKEHFVRDRPYPCHECGNSYMTIEELTGHIRVHQGKMPFACKKCEAGFWSLEELEKHQPIHVLKKVTSNSPKKIFACEVCLKEFRKICDLERHSRVHTGEKPVVCNICNKRFQQAFNLNKHLVIHTQEKNYECVICQKKFGRNDVLNRHILTHSVNKPFRCQICTKTFIRESQLNLHLVKHHKQNVQVSPKPVEDSRKPVEVSPKPVEQQLQPTTN